MHLFKENYGEVGFLRRHEWERKLNSNDGFLFKRADHTPERVLGPTLDDNGKVIGDLMAVEMFYFGKIATKRQNDFFEELLKINEPAAKEYVLVISGSIGRWKEDIKLLQQTLDYLEKEEKILEKEESLIEEEERTNISLNIPAILESHLPHIFGEMQIDNIEFDHLMAKMKKAEKNVEEEEHYLRGYLSKKKKEMPFLFE